ncbi:hypothetical protein T03_7052 [Trichinella britovi]|uniref:Uncharacterized protein n=1 Tax=Trichinella britovi TaxID=45882 RepID=A0A0V1CRL6_TRIBR|nr:hypothetical protein T03_7052 [Trichinella britovi]
MLIAIIYLPHHRLSLTLFIKDQLIANKLRQINFDGKFFRFGMEYLNIPLYMERSFLTVKQYTMFMGSDGKQFMPQVHMKGKQLVVLTGYNLIRPIPTPTVTLSQQHHTSLVGKN